MLLLNEVSIFSNSKNPSKMSVFEKSVLFLIVSDSIFRRNFYIQTESFNFNTWRVIFPFEAYPAIYCINPRSTFCNVVHMGTDWYQNQCDCCLIFATNLLCSFYKSGHVSHSFSHNPFLKVYSLKAQWDYRAEQDGLEMSSAIYVSLFTWQACLSGTGTCVHCHSPRNPVRMEADADAEQSCVQIMSCSCNSAPVRKLFSAL